MKFSSSAKLFVTLLAAGALLQNCGPTGTSTNQLATATDSAKAAAPRDGDTTLPYRLEFVAVNYPAKPPLPKLQSYVIATSSSGLWVVTGGRRQGLHTFMPAPATNFVKDSANNYIFVIDPSAGDHWSFNVNQLGPDLSAPLQSTNQQSYFDAGTHMLYIVGGYGWKADGSNMITFNTIMRFNVDAMAAAVKAGASPAQITQLIQVDQDDRFAVTGGELFNMGGNFYLVFGQKFTGQYRAFGGSDFQQQYIEEVRVFNLVPNTLKINSYGSTTNTDPDHPFHRRDGNTIDDVDPVTGQPRITALGGVFQPGIIGAYTYPVYINSPSAPTLQRNANQKFSQYECPVISVYDSLARSVHHTFFGGIGHWYYCQTDTQKVVYDLATAQGRNDGFPFVEDITTFLQCADGTYKEFIHPDPVPGNRLLGASIPFIVNPALATQGLAYSNGVIKLNHIQAGARLLIGHIYGGVEAQNPLPLHPNTGTFVSNTVFQVFLTYSSAPVIPASRGHESTKNDVNLHRK